ncbi:MAG TPA: DNA polymerase domain-containing protein [Candidatus Thermoplasmatota archaeon]|nr:DNA polymerase domain-containing protein [Candidatus Thermoplasmatota archaeon]
MTPDPRRREMVAWVKTPTRVVPTRHSFTPAFYVSGPRPALEDLARTLPLLPGVEAPTWGSHLLGLAPGHRRALKVPVRDMKRLMQVAKMVDARGEHRDFTLYDVDLRASQRFFMERGLFPFANVRLEPEGLVAIDDAWDLRYDVPALSEVHLDVVVEDMARLKGPIVHIEIEGAHFEGREEDLLSEAQARLHALDPDVVHTDGGDRWMLDHLAARAAIHGIAWDLGRDATLSVPRRRARSFHQYGHIRYSAPTHPLVGRIHVDHQSSFFFRESGLAGIIDLARISGVPLGEIARLEAGTAVTAMQIGHAKRAGRLIPWKKNMPEKPKTLRSLVKADRGGYIYDPRVGLHEDVIELDFSSLYPALIAKHNLGAETILCSCCDPRELAPECFVPQIGFHVCDRQQGLVPQVLTKLVHRRSELKKMRKRERKGTPKFNEYKGRVDALKWLNVVSFGYQGYKNARFGCIEAHEATCAWAREALLSAAEVARESGYEVLHGIVDSLWLERTTPAAISAEDLAERVEQEVGIPFEPQGRYHWIVFLPTRAHVAPGAPSIGAPNRFYGLFDKEPDAPTRSQAGQDIDHIAGGALKVRGVELRQSSAPQVVATIQAAFLEALCKAKSAAAFHAIIPDAFTAARPHVRRLQEGAYPLEELVIEMNVTSGLEGRTSMTHTTAALHQMKKLGHETPAGDRVRYVITDAESRDPEQRVRVASRLHEGTRYDADAYLTLVVRALTSLLLPLGYDEALVRDALTGAPRQVALPRAR